MKEMKINVPEGHEIDTERSDLSTGEIYFREKKPEFKVDDWIVRIGKEEYGALKILKSTYGGSRYYQVTGGFGYIIDPDCKHSCGFYRHATPSEIAEAKERLREKELPKRWEDLKEVSGFFVDSVSDVTDSSISNPCAYEENKNTWPTREEAEASIALAQLCQLRDAYNGCYVTDLDREYTYDYEYELDNVSYESSWLVFKTHEIRTKFLNETEIQKLIEKAKPLL